MFIQGTCLSVLGESGGECPDEHHRKDDIDFTATVCTDFSSCMDVCCSGASFSSKLFRCNSAVLDGSQLCFDLDVYRRVLVAASSVLAFC